MGQFCECTQEHKVDSAYFFECAPLEDGHWTQFAIHRCRDCGKLGGFPHENFLHAVLEGTPEVVEELEKLGVDVQTYRREYKKEEIEAFNPSRR